MIGWRKTRHRRRETPLREASWGCCRRTADGNQTLVKTKTGIWSVVYNGENRPINWTCGSTNIVMKYDRMGRRVEYVETVADDSTISTNKHQRFVYDNYLCVERLDASNTNSVTDVFVWDPTEPIATRPLFWQPRTAEGNFSLFYTHDGNKNVSEVVFYQRARGVAAHYEYAPFGEVTMQTRGNAWGSIDLSMLNPWRFSSEYADDTMGLVYYNYRHCELMVGRWICRDVIDDTMPVRGTAYRVCGNNLTSLFDVYGLMIFIDNDVSPMDVSNIPFDSTKRATMPRGRFVIKKDISIKCDSDANMTVSGYAIRRIELLEDENVLWNDRRPWYDIYGVIRSNAQEKAATTKHEEDHYHSYDAFFDYLETLSSYETQYPSYCDCISEQGVIEATINIMFNLAKSKSSSYDQQGRRQGGVYPL